MLSTSTEPLADSAAMILPVMMPMGRRKMAMITAMSDAAIRIVQAMSAFM